MDCRLLRQPDVKYYGKTPLLTTVVSVAENFILPDNSEGVIATAIEGGEVIPLLSREWKTVTLRSRGNGF